MTTGIGVSPGIAIAKATVLEKQKIRTDNYCAKSTAQELEAFEKARQEVAEETQQLYEKALTEVGEEKAAIFTAHQMILEDPELMDSVKQAIEVGSGAPSAIEETLNSFISMFEEIDDPYLRERASDVRDIKERLMRKVLNIRDRDICNLPENTILVSADLMPSDTARMDAKHVVGFVTQLGGRTSHTAIMARSLQIPAIAGIPVGEIKDGDILIIDGDAGVVYMNPDADTVSLYEKRKTAELKAREELKGYIGRETVTVDGHKVELAANIGTPQVLNAALENDAEGIGLFRSEFLFMDRPNLPSEDEQFEAYKKVLQGMHEKRVIIRTLDIGGDKEIPAMGLAKEENPFLGYRAIRLCLDRPELFKTQLRALLRASLYGKLAIMFPMISSLTELRQAKAVLEEVKLDLSDDGIAYARDIPVGIMIEVPAAAMISGALAKEADFFSIGTNDLIQYTLAVDRGNAKIAHLYNPCHPAILQLVAKTIESAHANGIFCGMCGEAASDERLTPVWLGLGLDEFSMNADSIMKLRRKIHALSFEDCKKTAQRVLELASAEEVLAELEKLNQK